MGVERDIPVPRPEPSTKPKSLGVEGPKAKRKRRNIPSPGSTSPSRQFQPRASFFDKELEEVWTRFWLVKRVTGSFKIEPPFKIDFDIRSCVGKGQIIYITHDCLLLIEAMNKDQVPKLLEIET